MYVGGERVHFDYQQQIGKDISLLKFFNNRFSIHCTDNASTVLQLFLGVLVGAGWGKSYNFFTGIIKPLTCLMVCRIVEMVLLYDVSHVVVLSVFADDGSSVWVPLGNVGPVTGPKVHAFIRNCSLAMSTAVRGAFTAFPLPS